MKITAFIKQYKTELLLTLLILGGIFLRFYNLNWGAPFYFHPDERNIAASVSQVNYPEQLNPHFFAYGSLPIYTIYFTGVIVNFVTHFLHQTPYQLNPTFEQAVVISRFYSALFSTLLIPILFLLGKKITHSKSGGLLAAFLATTSVGLIQFAHFGTFELWLTFFTVLLFWACLSLRSHANDHSLLILGLLSGVLVSIKVSHLAIIPLVFFVITLQEIYQNRNRHHVYKAARIIRSVLLFTIIVGAVYFLTNPYVLIDQKSFLGSMKYESGVATGSIKVFYTGEFFNTIPVVYQLTNVYPFILNPLLMVLSLSAFLYVCVKAVQKKNFAYFLIISFFLLLLLSQAFLFVKWTRYMIPTLPFVYLIITIALFDLSHHFLQYKKSLLTFSFNIVFTLFILANTLFALAYFVTVYVQPDTRVQAEQFAKKNIPHDAVILSEVYDIGITPFNEDFRNITLLNLYDLDNNAPGLQETITNQVQQAEYFVVPSQRIFKPRDLHKKNFPNGNAFYADLFRGKSGYQVIYQTQCDIFCKIAYLGDPVYSYEQTANVFDRPTVLLFKKQ